MTKDELLNNIERNIDDVRAELAIWIERRDSAIKRLEVCQKAIDECHLSIQNFESIKKEVMSI